MTRDQIEKRLGVSHDALDAFCRKWKIVELALFGSVLRDDFTADSDVDVLVSFASDAAWGIWDFAQAEDELKALLNRDVDLVQREAVEQSENYIRRQAILSSAQVLYGA